MYRSAILMLVAACSAPTISATTVVGVVATDPPPPAPTATATTAEVLTVGADDRTVAIGGLEITVPNLWSDQVDDGGTLSLISPLTDEDDIYAETLTIRLTTDDAEAVVKRLLGAATPENVVLAGRPAARAEGLTEEGRLIVYVVTTDDATYELVYRAENQLDPWLPAVESMLSSLALP